MQRISFVGLLIAACAGSPPVTPSPGGDESGPSEPRAPSSEAVVSPAPDAAEVSDAAADVTLADAGAADAGATDAGDASVGAAQVACSAAADQVPYVVDLGPHENSAAMGPYKRSESDLGRPIRATLTALSAPKEFDAFNFASYLPYYVAGAYQEAIATRPGLRGTVRVGFVLDATGKATQVEIKAPGFPATFVDEVRDRASTTYVICPPLPTPAKVSATITLAPRTLRRPGAR
jgi:hypothetical protein